MHLMARLAAVKRKPTPAAVEKILPPDGKDEILLPRAMTMLDEAREEIRGNIDYSASLIEALRADREVMGKMLLRLENIITTRHVGMSALQAMRDEIRGRLEDGLVDRASSRPLNVAACAVALQV
jgi:hypothetical protein